MTLNDKRNLLNKLHNFHEAAADLLSAIYELEDDTFNDMRANEKYPFEKSFDEVTMDISCYIEAVEEEFEYNRDDNTMLVRDDLRYKLVSDDVKPVWVRNVKNHRIAEDKKRYFTAQVTDEEDGKTYDMNVIMVDEEPNDEYEVVPFKIVNYYHGEPSVEDTQSYIDDWKKECAAMQRVLKYLEAYLETNEGCFGSPNEEELYNEPLVRQTLEELKDIIMYHF